MKTTKLWMAVALLLLPLLTHAQSEKIEGKEKLRHFAYGFSISHFNVKDDAMSPVRYTGTSYGLNFGLRKERTKWLSKIDFGISGGSLKSIYFEEGDLSKTVNMGIELDYTLLRRMKALRQGELDWFLGGSIGQLGSFRFHSQLDNSAGIYDSFTSIGLTSAIRKKINLGKRKFTFYYQVNVPVLSVVMRPSFNGLFNFVDPESDFFQENFDKHGLASFGSFMRLNNRFELSYVTKGSQNRLNFGYQWDVYHYNRVHKTVVGRHQLSLSTLFYF